MNTQKTGSTMEVRCTCGHQFSVGGEEVLADKTHDKFGQLIGMDWYSVCPKCNTKIYVDPCFLIAQDVCGIIL